MSGGAQRGHLERPAEHPDYDDAAMRLVGVSEWIDSANAHRHADTNLWSRVSKAAEEGGEAMDALRGYLGENPRKGQTCGLDDVVAELLDTAVAALGAIEHITGHDGLSLARLVEHIEYVHDRMQEATRPTVIVCDGPAGAVCECGGYKEWEYEVCEACGLPAPEDVR